MLGAGTIILSSGFKLPSSTAQLMYHEILATTVLKIQPLSIKMFAVDGCAQDWHGVPQFYQPVLDLVYLCLIKAKFHYDS